jgi:FKBP-type peptidyl-prolyl cis-trans isomerase
MRRFAAILAVACLAACNAALAADPALSPQANTAYLNSFAQKPGVVVRPSGLEYRILQNGFGARPGLFDSVQVYYKGQLINGKIFDQTEPGFPAEFEVNGVIPGWTEALQLMREGDHWQLVIPATLGYGTRGAGAAIPANQTLIFDVQLVKAIPAPPSKDQDKDKDDSQ